MCKSYDLEGHILLKQSKSEGLQDPLNCQFKTLKTLTALQSVSLGFNMKYLLVLRICGSYEMWMSQYKVWAVLLKPLP